MNTKTFLKSSVIALGFALGSTAAMAQAGPGAGQGQGQGMQQGQGMKQGQKQGADMRKQGRMTKDGKRAYQNFGMMVPGYGPVPQDVVDSLNLTDDQKDKIAKVKADIQEKMQERRNAQNRPFAAMAELRAKQLADGKLDPEAILKQRDELRETMQDRRGEFTDEWIEVWKDLSDEQQAKISEYFKDAKAARADRMKNKRDGSGPGSRQ